MKQPVFTGAAVAMITPMHGDGTVNVEELGRKKSLAFLNGKLIVPGSA